MLWLWITHLAKTGMLSNLQLALKLIEYPILLGQNVIYLVLYTVILQYYRAVLCLEKSGVKVIRE